MGRVVEALDGRLFDGPVQALDLPVRPRMLWFCQTMFDIKLSAGAIERMATEHGCRARPVLRQIGELDAVVGQHRMDLVRNDRDQRLEEAAGCGHAGGLGKLDEGELRRPVDCDEEVQLAFRRPHFGDVDVEVADRVSFELAPSGLVAVDLRQSRDAVALQAAVQRRAGQIRDRRL